MRVTYRAALNGVLWRFSTGMPWNAIQREGIHYHTCRRHFKLWHRSGVLGDRRYPARPLYGDRVAPLREAAARVRARGGPSPRAVAANDLWTLWR